MIALRAAKCAVLAGLLSVQMAQAQQIIVESLDDPVDSQVDGETGFITETDSDVFLRGASLFEEITEEVRAVKGTGVDLRALDKTTGEVRDITLSDGQSEAFGYLRIGLTECRHPDDNATGEAYAYLTIVEEANTAAPVFQGWMIASSPALNAMDHARFDVWVLRCQVDAAVADATTEETSGN
ncbi:DUF2155 domain-containing protein [Cognatishimia sp.]|uniref:DUF2155 domain-containing protein n=1 Tax=Cognatishimia sp. TaxID=2211648 RepID=UPI0035126B6C